LHPLEFPESDYFAREKCKIPQKLGGKKKPEK
jgi:hypothetical protein